MFLCQFEHCNDVENNATHSHCRHKMFRQFTSEAAQSSFEIDGKIKVQKSIRSSMVLAAVFLILFAFECK